MISYLIKQTSQLPKLLGKMILLLLFVAQVFASHPQVCLDNAAETCYKGSWLSTSTGIEYRSFQGIRYAKAPIEELRFKAPEINDDPGGLVHVSAESKVICPQEIGDRSGYQVSEDCLFLNVYAPQVLDDETYPVMVFIHGGAFILGSGTYQDYNPEFFMEEQKVVIVTINYRLGPLGFLYLDPQEVNGNAGFYDQILALQWVQQNIASFGGDPGSVTIFGESAGSNSVAYHILSPASKGLFQRAIMESGTAIDPAWPVLRLDQAERQGKYVLDELGCADLTCLQNESVDNLIGLLEHMTYWNAVWNTSYFPKDPKVLLQNGEFNTDIEVILGTNKDEGILALAYNIVDPTLWRYWQEQFETKVPFEYFGKYNQSDITEQDIKNIYKVIEHYVGSIENINDEHLQSLINSKTDAEYFYGTFATLDNFIKHGTIAFQYILTFVVRLRNFFSRFT